MTENNFYCLRFYVTYRCNSKCSYCNVWKDEIIINNDKKYETKGGTP